MLKRFLNETKGNVFAFVVLLSFISVITVAVMPTTQEKMICWYNILGDRVMSNIGGGDKQKTITECGVEVVYEDSTTSQASGIPSNSVTVFEYDVAGYFNTNSHPSNGSEMLAITDDITSGVNLSGSQTWNQVIDGTDGPITGQDVRFSSKFVGSIYVDEDGVYTFATDSDDASDIRINGVIVASWYGGHGHCNCWDHNGTITLSKGYHTLEYRVMNGDGPDAWRLGWKTPSQSNIDVMPIQ